MLMAYLFFSFLTFHWVAQEELNELSCATMQQVIKLVEISFMCDSYEKIEFHSHILVHSEHIGTDTFWPVFMRRGWQTGLFTAFLILIVPFFPF